MLREDLITFDDETLEEVDIAFVVGKVRRNIKEYRPRSESQVFY